MILLPLCSIPGRVAVKCLLQQHLQSSGGPCLKEEPPFGHLSSVVTDFLVTLPKGVIHDVIVSCACLQVSKNNTKALVLQGLVSC